MKLNNLSKALFKDTYFLKDEDFLSWSARMSVDRFNSDIDGTSDERLKPMLFKMQEYIQKRWFQPSTPISANLGTKKGMPISCFVRELDDSRSSIFYSFYEGFWLGSEGTGLGSDYSAIRSIGEPIKGGLKGTTSGIVPFIKVSDSSTLAISQGSTRRSSEAVYLDISHPEIEEFISLRKASNNTDINRYCPNIHHAVKIPDSFMQAVIERKSWALRSPKTKEVVKEIDAFKLFVDILDIRTRFAGEPYLFFIDNANRQRASLYKELDLPINLSNLCTEIALHTDFDKSNICCLGSINLALYDEFKDEFEEVIKTCLIYLDFIVECFIKRCKEYKSYTRALKGALQDRALGLGVMGYHTLLQAKMLPFKSLKARELNIEIFSRFSRAKELYEAYMKEQGFPKCELGKFCKDYHRNAAHFAIAPTMNISNLCNQVSGGIEPIFSNYYSKKLKQGTFAIKNPHLDALLDKYSVDKDKVWSSILNNQGSVAHLDFLTEYEKEVFKTAYEIEQDEIILQAKDRQPFIDQAQSINLFFTQSTNVKDIFNITIKAWQEGIKSLYYQRSLALSRVINTNQRQQICPIDGTCDSCQ